MKVELDPAHLNTISLALQLQIFSAQEVLHVLQRQLAPQPQGEQNAGEPPAGN